MSVYHRKNKWYINITLGAVRINRRAGSSKKEAKQIESELKTRYRLKQFNIEDIKRDTSFGMAATEYMEYIKGVRSKRTYEMYDTDYRKHLQPFFEHYILQDISNDTLLSFQGKQKSKGYANRTVNIHMELVRKIMNYARTKKYIGNIDLKYPMLREPKKLHAFLTPDEYRAFKKELSYDKVYLRTVFGRNTGLRPSELTYLAWEDVSFEMQSVKVQSKPECGWIIKTEEERVVHLNNTALSILHRLNKEKKGRWVFSDNDKPVKSNRRALQTAAEKAGLSKKVTPNMLRHTFATHALLNGGDLLSVKELMGHKNISTTEKYLHAIKEYTKRTVELLDKDEGVGV
jgi:integrase/recombinase XerD